MSHYALRGRPQGIKLLKETALCNICQALRGVLAQRVNSFHSRLHCSASDDVMLVKLGFQWLLFHVTIRAEQEMREGVPSLTPRCEKCGVLNRYTHAASKYLWFENKIKIPILFQMKYAIFK